MHSYIPLSTVLKAHLAPKKLFSFRHAHAEKASVYFSDLWLPSMCGM